MSKGALNQGDTDNIVLLVCALIWRTPFGQVLIPHKLVSDAVQLYVHLLHHVAHEDLPTAYSHDGVMP